jgi:hypothetical protein
MNITLEFQSIKDIKSFADELSDIADIAHRQNERRKELFFHLLWKQTIYQIRQEEKNEVRSYSV